MAKYKQDQFVSIGDILCEIKKLSCDPMLVCKTCSLHKKALCYECFNKVPSDCYPKPIVTMTRKQYKPGQFFWIRGCQYRIARVERHVQDPCDKCDVPYCSPLMMNWYPCDKCDVSFCSPSMMNWCANLMPTHHYFKKC